MSVKYEPLSGREFPRFSAIRTFFRLPHVALDADYDLGLIGVPFDGGVSYRPGARFGPSAIREASSLGRVYHWGRMAAFTERVKAADLGDCSTVPIDREKTYQKVEQTFAEILRLGKRTLAFGGDHSLTLPILRAFRQKFGRPLGFVHFDAHLDTYPAAWGEELHHGAFARHAVEEGLVDPKKMVQIGIRGPLAGASDLDFIKRHGIEVLTIDDLRAGPLDSVLKRVPDFGGLPVYLSYDIDCLDPAFAPGTGTPVPGGLTTSETQQILRRLKIKNLVGADIVEVSPPYDHAQITALAAVDAAFEILHLFSN
jgi:agmatinase/guanidinopropionase